MIKDKIQSKVAKAFDTKLADAVHAFTCIKIINSGEYGSITETLPDQIDGSYSGRGVLFGSYEKFWLNLLIIRAQILKPQ